MTITSIMYGAFGPSRRFKSRLAEQRHVVWASAHDRRTNANPQECNLSLKSNNKERHAITNSKRIVNYRAHGYSPFDASGSEIKSRTHSTNNYEHDISTNIIGETEDNDSDMDAILLARAKFRRVLCANRGEIAVRVFRGMRCQKM